MYQINKLAENPSKSGKRIRGEVKNPVEETFCNDGMGVGGVPPLSFSFSLLSFRQRTNRYSGALGEGAV